jgi:enoyl-CoA hydratase/carnithine racemase
MATISVRVADGVAHLELNRPEVRNAINVEMVREITASLDQLSDREEVRALVLSGAGKAFASGADISELRERTHREGLLAINAAARGAEPSSLERLGQALLFDSPEKQQRMTAFLQKRGRK